MSYSNDDDPESNGIRMSAPPQDQLDKQLSRLIDLESEVKKKDERITQLTAMCYTLARRLRNESFQDNITAVTRQQMAELAMQSLTMTPQVWDLVHRSEEQQRQEQ